MMVKIVLALSLSLAVVGASWSHGGDDDHDRISGVARADFLQNKLYIPCVRVEHLNENADGKYFDVILTRRGNSFNYELELAEPEDSAECQTIDNFSKFVDDDFVDDNNHDDDGDDDIASSGKVLITCEVRPGRSKISVNGRNLPPGEYMAEVTSGDSTVQTGFKSTIGDEVEFDYDSDPDDVAAGATAISSDFIQNQEVSSAKILDADGKVVVSMVNVTCLQKD